MRSPIRYLLAGLGVVALGCTADQAGHPTMPSSGLASELGDEVERVVVMTQNLYVGANVDAILAALTNTDPTDDIPTLLAQVQVLSQTDFPTRARALAREVARTRPHVIGLQEVSTLDIDLPPLGVSYHMEFLPALLAAFEVRGLEYEVAAVQQNFQATPFPGISLIDKDVILVDAGRVGVESAVADTYTVNLGPVVPGVTLLRGYAGVRATVAGQAVSIFSTHLEDNLGPLDLSLVRAAQMGELVQVIGEVPLAIVMGDLNDVTGSLMYQQAVGAGFRDVWVEKHTPQPGNTCCHRSDLSNPLPGMSKRIDYVLARGFARDEGELHGSITRVGYLPADKEPGPYYSLWVSDHAGVVAGVAPPQ